MTKLTVDITPHPRILSVLGEIEFEPWQCVAELIDNCVDSFLESARVGAPIADPTVQVAFGRDTVVVKDNGPGMSITMLENAVKAGWTSQEPFGSLGLYGVGFNIATARLGGTTTIWTTRTGDPEWYGLDIDLRALSRGGKYTLEVKTRTKSNARDSGTEVQVAHIRQDWVQNFASGSWIRANVTGRLARIYGTMLREVNPQPLRFALRVNDKRVTAWEHCVWPSDWTVYRKDEGLVRPVREIDVTFGIKYLCRSTGEIHDSADGLDPADVVPMPERVYGWIGVQRYADEQDFGIDILRNGRKIEWGCKDIFNWEDADGNIVREYPIDDPRGRGRIVGEIHLDHGYVHYTKHRFEREHSSWKQLLRAVRDNEPLTNRENRGYAGVNTSHLGILFRAFRRNSPHKGSGLSYSDILFIKENETAKAWAREWRKGSAEYRDDSTWRRELEASDAPPPPPTPPAPSPRADGDAEDGEEPPPAGDQGPAPGDDAERSGRPGTPAPSLSPDDGATPALRRTPMPELNLHVTGIGITGKAYDVEVYRTDPGTPPPHNAPWWGGWSARGVYEVLVDLDHPAFKSTSLTVRDAVLAELAHVIASEESASTGSRQPTPYGEILVALRARYSTMDSLDVNRLRVDIEEIRKRLCAHVSRVASAADRDALIAELPPQDVERLKLAQARGPLNASMVDYLTVRQLAMLLERHPELFFDGSCIGRRWNPAHLLGDSALLTTHQARLLRDLLIPLSELGDFSDMLVPLPDESRSYLALVRACVNRVQEYLADGDS